MYPSKLTSKYQATIPKEIRKKLHLKAGDSIIFQVLEDGTVSLKKLNSLDKAYLRALSTTLNEWESEQDEQAYEHLQHL